MNREKLVLFWVKTAGRDLKSARHLLEKGDYNWSLFLGHLYVEKLIKAYYVKMINDQPPYVHNLLRLAEKSNLELTEEQKDLLVVVTTFNIRARYDDYKQEFYKICTREFAVKWMKKLEEFGRWIKKRL